MHLLMIFISKEFLTQENDPPATIATSTHKLLANLLSESTDTTPVLQDTTVHVSGPHCDAADADKDRMHIRIKMAFAGKMTSANNLVEQIANEFGEVTLEAQFHKNRHSGGVVLCRNCGEVAPYTKITDTLELDNKSRKAPYQPFVTKQKQTMWAMIKLIENDQLCQQMAWALYRIYNAAS
eukprot:12255674-Ditylum_brightwellii.AAC.1